MIDWGGGGGNAVAVQVIIEGGAHLLIATNPTSVKIPCVYASGRKGKPREDLITDFNIGCIL